MPKRNRSNRPRPPVGERANRGRESTYIAVCPGCGKRGYTSRQQAKRAAARLHPGKTMRFYQCGTLWHMSSVNAGTTAEYREQQAGSEEVA